MAKQKRGFAAMSEEQKKRIASLGGKAAHKLGVAHRYNSVEAAVWGSKGGKISNGGRGRDWVNPNKK